MQCFEGLKDHPPIHKSHPRTAAPEVVEHIKVLIREHPAWLQPHLGANPPQAPLRDP